MFNLITICFIISTFYTKVNSHSTNKTSPITYLIHGVGSSSKQLVQLENALKSQGVNVYNLGLTGDPLTSIFTPMDKQCSLYNEEIIGTLQVLSSKSNILTNTTYPLINLIGISQGGLLARCYVERYSNNNVNTLMTLGTPHMGIYDKNIPNLK